MFKQLVKDSIKDVKGTIRFWKVMSKRKKKVIFKAYKLVYMAIGVVTILEMFN